MMILLILFLYLFETTTILVDSRSVLFEDYPTNQSEVSVRTEVNNFLGSPYVRHKELFKPKGQRYLDKSLFDTNPEYCKRNAKCETLQTSKCMGAKLPYHSTTLDLTDLSSQAKVQEKLLLYEQYLRYIPKCWAVIQPFFCALYMPKCEDEQVDLPSREMCRIILQPCQIVYNSTVFPEFFNCEDERLFPSKCRNDIHEMKFNTTGYCMEPLIRSDKAEWWFKDVEGCGLHCKDSLYTENEIDQIHNLIKWCASICIVLGNFIAIMTFVMDWRTANKYPVKAIFFVNICFLISNVGWIVQFIGYDTREDIVCKKDGTLRKSEPSATENLSCVVIFFLVYYFLIAGLVWFMIFSYAWYMSSLQALGKIQDRVDKKRAYFHLVAWSLPLILTITTMAIGEIDGDYTMGICFVGFVNLYAKGLYLAPLISTRLISIYFIVQGLILLIEVKSESEEVISQDSARRIQSVIVRMAVFIIFMVLFCIVTISYHIYVAINRDQWNASLENYILCKLTSFSMDYSHCKQSERPSVAMLQLQLLAIFGEGIAMASWTWCCATLRVWRRFSRKILRKCCGKMDEDTETMPMKVQKHKIITRVYSKRKKYNEGENISVWSQNHTDPVGLQFELNGAASNELSSSFVRYLPRLVNRRQAALDSDLMSDLSVIYRHVSIESRMNSGDSQVSVQIAEVKASFKHHFRSRSRNIGNSSNMHSRYGSKRDSSTSLDSHFQILNALTNGNDVANLYPNMNRRTANAGLDGAHFGHLLSNGKFVLPCTGSEDESVSVTISESTFSMTVANQNLDLNDQFTISQLRDGLNIQQISTSEDENMSNKDYDQEKRFSRSGRDSRSSKRSKKSKRSRVKYSSDSDSYNEPHLKGPSESSSCPELKQLVQSSVNSAASGGFEGNRSRQSKTSMDVAVQANAHDLDLEMNKSNEDDQLNKSKQAKTRENKKYRRASKYKESLEVDASKNSSEKIRKWKDKYRNDGSVQEKEQMYKDNRSDSSDEEALIVDNNKIFLERSKEIAAKY